MQRPSGEAPARMPRLKIKPYSIGVETETHCVLRTIDEALYVTLTHAELDALQELSPQAFASAEKGQQQPDPFGLQDGRDIEGRWPDPPHIDTFITRHMRPCDEGALGYEGAVALLLRLYQNGFLDGASDALRTQAQKYAQSLTPEPAGAAWRGMQNLGLAIEAEILSFRGLNSGRIVKKLGSLWLNWPMLVGLGIYLALFALPQLIQWFMGPGVKTLTWMQPVPMLMSLLFAVSIAFSFHSLMRMFALLGAGVKRIQGSIRFMAGFLPRFDIDDRDALLLNRRRFLHYQTFVMMLPWGLASLCAVAGPQMTAMIGPSYEQVLGWLPWIYVVIGAFDLAPLGDTAFTRWVQGDLARLDLAAHAWNNLFDSYPERRPFGGHVQSLKRGTRESKVAFRMTCFGVLWLKVAVFAAGTVFFDGAASLLAAAKGGGFSQTLSAAVLFGGIFVAATVPIVLLLSALGVQLGRFIADFVLPAGVKVKHALLGAPENSMVRQTKLLKSHPKVCQFLRAIPIFEAVKDSTIMQISEALQPLQWRAGQTIMGSGERFRGLYIIMQGRAQVLASKGAAEVVDLLTPGHFFGEVSFVRAGYQLQPIRAFSVCRVLFLSIDDFKTIFPEGSKDYRRVMKFITYSRLLSEYPTLPGITSPLVRAFLSHSVSSREASNAELSTDALPRVKRGRVGKRKQRYKEASKVVENQLQGLSQGSENATDAYAKMSGKPVAKVATLPKVDEGDSFDTPPVDGLPPLTEKRTVFSLQARPGQWRHMDVPGFANLCRANVFLKAIEADLRR